MYILVWHLTHICLHMAEPKSEQTANSSFLVAVPSLVTVSHAILKLYKINKSWLEKITVITL